MPRLGTRKLYVLLKEDLRERGLKVGRDKLFSLLGNNRLLIRPRESYTKTTGSKHWLRKHKNLVEGLEIPGPEQVFVSGITYVPTNDSHSYLSLVTDAYPKKIMGHHLAQDLRAKGPVEALRMAVSNRKYGHGLIPPLRWGPAVLLL